MKYLDFLSKIRKEKLYIFGLNDVLKYFPETSLKTAQNQVQSWNKEGMLSRVRRDLYHIVFPEGGPDVPDLYIANKIYEPSYVSSETALSFYNVIPEVSANVCSITTRHTRTFKNKYGYFIYRSCRKKAFCGYKIINYEGFKIYMAEKEKALVDYIYFKNVNGEIFDYASERFDEDILRKISWKKVYVYAGLYGHRVVNLIEMIKREI